MDVRTAASEVSCGYPFNEGVSYLVFASEGATRGIRGLEVGPCGSTKPLSESGKTLAALGPSADPTGSPSAGARLPDTSGARPENSNRDLALAFASCAVTLILALATVGLAVRRRIRR